MLALEPPLLVRAWMMAHVYGAKYHAVVCSAGSSGEAAFREALRPQYTTHRHDSKGLRTYYITGTCGGTRFSRIASTRIGRVASSTNGGPLRITVTSNTSSWREVDLSFNQQLGTLTMEVERLVEVSNYFLSGCSGLEHVNLESLSAIEKTPEGFLSGCRGLKEVWISAP